MNFQRGYADHAYGRAEEFPGPPPAPENEREIGFDLRAITAFLWRAKWRAAAGGIVGLSLAAVHLAGMDATYTARATVLFSPDRNNVATMQETVSRPNDPNEVVNQIEILRSAMLRDRVVERLELWRQPDFNPRLRPDDGLNSKIRSLLDWRTYVPWQLLYDTGVLPPPPPPRDLTKEEQLERDRQAASTVLLRRLNPVPVPNSNVINIRLTADNPDLAARVANTVASEYITAQLDAKLAATREATIWLSDRVEELKDEVSEAERAVSTYSAELAERTGQTSAMLKQQLDALNDSLVSVGTTRAETQARYDRALAALADDRTIATLPELEDSRVINEARARERELLASRTELERLVPPGHQRLELLDARLEQVRGEIRDEARRIAESLRNQAEVARDAEQDLRTQVAALEQRIQEQSTREVQLRQLQREAEASRLIYENFLGRLKETTQQQKLEDADAIILSPAKRPNLPDSASKKRIAALGLILGVGFGFGVAFLLHRLNNTFRSVDELEGTLGLTAIGTLPFESRTRKREDVLNYIIEKPSSSLAEAVRSLRTSILLSGAGDPSKVVMITSSVPTEGKSTTGVLLANTTAQMGRRAIVVDCDLRRPSVAAFFGDAIEPSTGLRGVLDGSLTLEQAQQVHTPTGVHVMATAVDKGTTVNAADVLASERFASVVEWLRRNYDLVVLDAPPTLSVVDARIIAGHADATVFCVRWDFTPREVAASGLRELLLGGVSVAGVVGTMAHKGGRGGYGTQHAYYGYGRAKDPYYVN